MHIHAHTCAYQLHLLAGEASRTVPGVSARPALFCRVAAAAAMCERGRAAVRSREEPKIPQKVPQKIPQKVPQKVPQKIHVSFGFWPRAGSTPGRSLTGVRVSPPLGQTPPRVPLPRSGWALLPRPDSAPRPRPRSSRMGFAARRDGDGSGRACRRVRGSRRYRRAGSARKRGASHLGQRWAGMVGGHAGGGVNARKHTAGKRRCAGR